MKNKLIALIVVIIILIISIFSFIIISSPDYFNLNQTENRNAKKVYYNLTYDNSTNTYNLMIGPFINEIDKLMVGARITLNIGEIEYIETTNLLGISEFNIQEQDLEDIIDKKITGLFQKNDHYDSDFKFTITNLNERGEFEILIRRGVDH